MLLAAFFSWWYGPGWKQVSESLRPRLQTVANSFSVQLLLPTLFQPWRRIVTTPGRSLEAKFHAAVDNVFSRAVGFVVRVAVLFAAILSASAVAALTLLELILWPLAPLAIPGCLILGLIVWAA